MALRPRDCPCGSGERYAACCGPLHEGKRSAATPEALMRSRFAAFAVGAGMYLVDTLAADHPDHPGRSGLHKDLLARELGRAREKQRFLGLRILYAENDEVLFVARIFEKGSNRSFAELSRFVREDGAWRYASGDSVPHERLPEDLDNLDRETFVELARAGGLGRSD